MMMQIIKFEKKKYFLNKVLNILTNINVILADKTTIAYIKGFACAQLIL